MNESELDQILWEEQLEHENYLLSLVPDEDEPWTDCCGTRIDETADGSAYLCSSCHAGVTAEGISQESH
jgi:hypothetical protein